MRRPEKTITPRQLQSMVFAAALAAHKERDPKYSEFYAHHFDTVAAVFPDVLDSPFSIACTIYEYITNNIVTDGDNADPETAVDEWKYTELTDLLFKCHNIRVVS